MFKRKDILISKKRKRFWDIMGWTYKGLRHLSKNHSLNCGCILCKMHTYEKRLNNRRERYKTRVSIKREIENLFNNKYD